MSKKDDIALACEAYMCQDVHMTENLRDLDVHDSALACQRDDVDPAWWIDADSRESGRPVEQRRDQLRAKLWCLQCPALFPCRDSAWDEPAHVWGGLTVEDRYRARREGKIRERDIGSCMPPSRETLRKFLKGAKTEDVAVTLSLREKTLVSQIKAEVRRRRLNLEGERTWGYRSPPPLNPPTMSMESYRSGRALSENFLLEDSA